MLADWLARSEWTIDEAAWLLTGFCPERSTSSEDQANDWYRLPGIRLHKPTSLDDAKWRDADLENQIRRKRGRLINDTPGGAEAAEIPQQILKRAKKGNYLPPWLKDAQEDQICNRLLPPGIRERKRSVAEANRVRVIERHASDPKQQLLNQEARRIFNRLAAAKFAGIRKNRSGDPYKVALAKVILDELQLTHPEDAPEDTRAIVNRIGVWLKRYKAESAGSETESLPA